MCGLMLHEESREAMGIAAISQQCERQGFLCRSANSKFVSEFCVLCFVMCELVFSYLCVDLQADDDNKKILLVDGLSGKKSS